MFGDLAINLAASVIYDFGKKIRNVAEKTETVLLVRKQLGISQTLHDFPDRYLEALIELRFEEKTKVVLDFFRSEDIMQTFFDFYYGTTDKRNNENHHTAALERHIEALQVGDAVKSAHVDVATEVQYFWGVFRQKVQESRTVKEVELQHEIEQLQATTKDTNELAKKVLGLIEQKGDEPLQAHLKQWAEKIYNIQYAGTVNFHIYGDRKIPTILTAPTASVPATFLGREKELQDIRQLLSSSNTLALVNSEGGMGKTTLAAAYWNQYKDQYKHLAWLFCKNGILSAMRSQLPQPLGLQEAMNAYADSPENQIATLKNNLANLDKDCLLVLDNANETADIKAFVADMNGLGWHILMTSRCTEVLSDRKNEYPITSLPPVLAKQLFKENYTEPSADFDALLDRFLKAVGYNTLCIEIFSKNMRKGGSWGYTFADFLTQLEQGGLFLGDNSFDIVTDYTNNVRKTAEKSDEIIRALYNFADLKAEDTDLLIQFALLPAENHPPEVLLALLPNENKHELKRRLDNLAQKGWLATDTTSYRISPVVQKIVLHQHSDRRWGMAEPMIQKLHAIFETEGYHSKHIATAAPYASLVFGLVENIDAANDDVSILFNRLWFYFTATGNLAQAMDTATRMQVVCEKKENKYLAISYAKLGETHTALGNLDKALKYYEDYLQLTKKLYEDYPNNADFKKGLAISYSKLGETHTALGNLDKALKYYEDEVKLFEELYEAYPNHVDFKNGLTISYSHLGEAHTALGNLDKALTFYEQNNQLRKELHKAYPNNVGFKDGLAISYSQLGERHTELGNLDKALKYYEDAVKLFEELYEAYPQNVDFKNGLAISYEKLGETHTAFGNLPKALTFFEEFDRLEKELHEAYPQNVEFKNGLAISYEKLGDTHSALGNLPKALTFFEDETKLFEELHKAYPQNVNFKNNLAISYSKLGSTHTALGNLPQALTFFEDQTRLFEELHEAYPQNVDFNSGYAESLSVLFAIKKLVNEFPNDADIDSAMSHFESLFSSIQTPYYQRKLVLCQQMKGADIGELNRLIAEISAF